MRKTLCEYKHTWVRRDGAMVRSHEGELFMTEWIVCNVAIWIFVCELLRMQICQITASS